jgi:hypothetical protein
LQEIDEDEFYPQPIPDRLILDEVEKSFSRSPISLDSTATINLLKKQLDHCCFSVEEVIKELIAFCRMQPRLPPGDKNWLLPQPLDLDECSSPQEVIDRLETLRATNSVADLAFAAYRDMSRTPWKPFIKAAMERNPVCVKGSQGMSIADAARKLSAMDAESIYSGKRMAQPDELWNYGRGDGLEKALCLMNIIKNRRPEDAIALEGDGEKIVVRHNKDEYAFTSAKNLEMPLASDFTT